MHSESVAAPAARVGPEGSGPGEKGLKELVGATPIRLMHVSDLPVLVVRVAR